MKNAEALAGIEGIKLLCIQGIESLCVVTGEDISVDTLAGVVIIADDEVTEMFKLKLMFIS